MGIPVGVVKELYPGERRVALAPQSMAALAKCGVQVLIERDAGRAAGFPDADYEQKGARAGTRAEVLAGAQIVLAVRTAGADPAGAKQDLASLRAGQAVIGMGEPLSDPEPYREYAAAYVTSFALELMPRITRAQSMDVLSSMATVAGYKATLLAADALPRMFPMLMTAAGTVAAARVLVIGAGVAGLQAIATARRLGAVVSGYDVRPAVKEQVESLGARFVTLGLDTGAAQDQGGYAKALGEDFYRRQRELMAEVIARHDVVITTAAVPGQRAPVLVTGEMVAGMAPGSVIVDLAAERGGNCELTKADQRVVEHGVTILGPTNLPSEAPFHASQMYAKNIVTFLLNLVKEKQVQINMEDEIIRDTLISRDGKVVNERIQKLL